MIDIPDAPWIRDAEINGMPESDDFTCPVCGAENPDSFYIDDNGVLLGCDECVKRVDAWTWYCEHKEDGRD